MVEHVEAKGTLLGVRAFITCGLHTETIRTSELCHLMSLDRASFSAVTKRNPGVAAKIIQNIRDLVRLL